MRFARKAHIRFCQSSFKYVCGGIPGDPPKTQFPERSVQRCSQQRIILAAAFAALTSKPAEATLSSKMMALTLDAETGHRNI